MPKAFSPRLKPALLAVAQRGVPRTTGQTMAEAVNADSDGKMTLGDHLGDLDAELDIIEDREALGPLLIRLSPRDRTILVLRFSVARRKRRSPSRLACHRCTSADYSAKH